MNWVHGGQVMEKENYEQNVSQQGRNENVIYEIKVSVFFFKLAISL